MSFFVILENGKISLKMTTMWQPKSKEQVQKNLGKQGEEDQGRGACSGSFGGPAWTRSYLPAWSAGPIQKPGGRAGPWVKWHTGRQFGCEKPQDSKNATLLAH